MAGAPPGFVQGLLGSLGPWMTGASPSALDNSFQRYGGTQGLLDAMMQAQSPAMFGQAMEGVQNDALQRAAARQQLAQGNVKTQESAMMLPFMLRYYQSMMGAGSPAAAPAPGSPAPGAQGQAPGPGGASGTPQDAPQLIRTLQQQQPQQPDASPFSAPTPQQIAGMPVNGMPAQMLTFGGMMNGQSPLDVAQKLRAQQIALAQQQYGPAVATLDTAMKAQNPVQYVSANPRLKATWEAVAPQYGFDPTKDFTNANVRTALAFARNRIAGALGEPTVAAPVQMGQVAGPLNSLYNRDPVTGALKQVRGEEQLKAVVGPNGQVTYQPASQASGQTAFNDQTYVNPTTTEGMARMIANYEIPPLSGFALRSAQGQAIMAAVKQQNPNYDATAYTTKNTARMKFAVGKQGDIVRSLSVATNHLDQLSQAADALNNGDIGMFNRVANALGVHVAGHNSVTNFDAMKEIVGDEVVKAVVGSSGAEGDREAIKEAFNAARSPAQLQGVIEKYEGLMGGQLQGLKRQYQRATGLKDFDSFVSTMAQQRLSAAAQGGRGKPASLNIGQSANVGGFTVTRVK
jgi:hypothetical protein